MKSERSFFRPTAGVRHSRNGATYRLLLWVQHRLAAATDVGSLRLCLKNPQGTMSLDPYWVTPLLIPANANLQHFARIVKPDSGVTPPARAGVRHSRNRLTVIQRSNVVATWESHKRSLSVRSSAMGLTVIQRSNVVATWESPKRSPSVHSSALRRECGTAAMAQAKLAFMSSVAPLSWRWTTRPHLRSGLRPNTLQGTMSLDPY